MRPGAKLAAEVHIGNFVEVKNSSIGLGSKANHFTYLGDAEVGSGSNIGAGTITCNYDGANKFKTIIGDHAFIGSNSSLVAPVQIGNGATVGAGSTITRDVAENSLAVERSKQFAKENYQRPQKSRNKRKLICGIVGGIAERNISNILIEGLKRLEYRGYDSAGLALINNSQVLRERRVGKVANLEQAVNESQINGSLGIAHTRWATHGKPTENNAHPHISGNVAVVHNGIIENYQELKDDLEALGYVFTSQTDTEVVAHLVNDALKSTPSLLEAVRQVVPQLKGAYALGIVHTDHSDELITVREGSPLVIGVGIGENFISSDQLALLPITNRFIYLEEGDIARLTRTTIEVFVDGQLVDRPVKELDATVSNASKGEYKHYMLKEIYEQPEALKQTISQALNGNTLREDFLVNAEQDFQQSSKSRLLPVVPVTTPA